MNTYLASAEPNMSVVILITGFVVVFAVLVLLIGIIWAYAKIVSLAQNFAQKRKEKNLNQLKVAMDLNISREALSHYENGKREPSLDMLNKLSKYFNVSIDYLAGIIDTPKKLI